MLLLVTCTPTESVAYLISSGNMKFPAWVNTAVLSGNKYCIKAGFQTIINNSQSSTRQSRDQPAIQEQNKLKIEGF